MSRVTLIVVVDDPGEAASTLAYILGKQTKDVLAKRKVKGTVHVRVAGLVEEAAMHFAWKILEAADDAVNERLR